MANEKISAMPAASALTGAELLSSVQSGDNKKATVQQVFDFVASGDGGVFSKIKVGDLTIDQYPGIPQYLRFNAAVGNGVGMVFSSTLDGTFGDWVANINGLNYHSGIGMLFNSEGTDIFFQPIGDWYVNSAVFMQSNGSILDINGMVLINREEGQQDAISKPSGGTTVDTEARTAIDSIIDVLQTLGLIA